jgi:hypothetical protein
MPARTGATRSHLVEMARLHHVLAAFSRLWFGSELGTLSGTERSGDYFYDFGTGHRLHLVWTSRALVGVVFDHESDRSAYGSEPSVACRVQDRRHPASSLGRHARRPAPQLTVDGRGSASCETAAT